MLKSTLFEWIFFVIFFLYGFFSYFYSITIKEQDMKKSIAFLLLSLVLTTSFSQNIDSIKIEFEKALKEYIYKNNLKQGKTVIDIVRAEQDVYVTKGFFIFKHSKKVHLDPIYGPDHGKVIQATSNDRLSSMSQDQARYLKEVTIYRQKTFDPTEECYISHFQRAAEDSVPDEALSQPRESLLKREVIACSGFFLDDAGNPEKTSKEIAEHLLQVLLSSPSHKKIIEKAYDKFGTALTFIPNSPEVLVNYSGSKNGKEFSGVRIEKRTGFYNQEFSVLAVVNFF